MLELALSAAIFLTAVCASAHAVIYKREPRAAALWIIVIWLIPAAGPLLYVFLGVNRVRRQARAMRTETDDQATTTAQGSSFQAGTILPEGDPLRSFAHLVERVTAQPLLPGNRIIPLIDGVETFPAMLDTIADASQSIGLATYIFDGEGAGKLFIEALGKAQSRGVDVRVLVDAVGATYSWPPITRRLRERGISVALFNPRLIPKWLPAINLRNHRKILVVDGKTGFTGGMNIKREYWSGAEAAPPSRDLHFQLSGPIVAHLSEAFADDWQFATGATMPGDKWFPTLSSAGEMLARGIEAGPDERFERLRWVILGALNAARRSIRIMTPYFLTDSAIISALNTAAMRGVEIDILLPEHTNLPYVHWATFGLLWQVLERGCRVWLGPGQFDHSKLMVMDETWCLLGSANWDARSLRLNFEFNVECHSPALAQKLNQLVHERLSSARALSLAEVDGRRLPIKLRDGIARLFTPYL